MFLWRGNAPHTLALAGSEAEISSEWHGAEQVTLRAENLLRVSIDALRVLSWGRGATSIPEGSHSNPARISPHLHGNIPSRLAASLIPVLRRRDPTAGFQARKIEPRRTRRTWPRMSV